MRIASSDEEDKEAEGVVSKEVAATAETTVSATVSEEAGIGLSAAGADASVCFAFDT